MNLSVEEPFFLRGRLAGNITEQDAHAIHWLTATIRRFDLKKVDQITLIWANQAPGAPSYVAGRCDRPPKRSRKIGFRLTAAAHGLPPYHVPIRKPPLYRKPDGVWQPAKSAARHAITWPNDILESLSAIELASERDAAERFRDEYQRHADGWVARLGEMRKTRDGQQWFGVGAILTLASLAEALVWQTSQTAFWWLRTTRQVAGRATDHGSHAFAGDYRDNAYQPPAILPADKMREVSMQHKHRPVLSRFERRWMKKCRRAIERAAKDGALFAAFNVEGWSGNYERDRDAAERIQRWLQGEGYDVERMVWQSRTYETRLLIRWSKPQGTGAKR